MQTSDVKRVEAWPTWLLTGPMSELTAINVTTGTRFKITYPLPAGQTITITTNRPTVRGPGGVNLSRYVDWLNPLGTELWPLIDDPNAISFLAYGAGIGTSVQMSFTPRFETA